MTYAEFAEEILYHGVTKERFPLVATYKRGKTWKDFYAACERGKQNPGEMFSSIERIRRIEINIQQVVWML